MVAPDPLARRVVVVRFGDSEGNGVVTGVVVDTTATGNRSATRGRRIASFESGVVSAAGDGRAKGGDATHQRGCPPTKADHATSLARLRAQTGRVDPRPGAEPPEKAEPERAETQRRIDENGDRGAGEHGGSRQRGPLRGDEVALSHDHSVEQIGGRSGELHERQDRHHRRNCVHDPLVVREDGRDHPPAREEQQKERARA